MTAVTIEVKIGERGLVEHLAAPTITYVLFYMDTVILVSSTVREDHNPRGTTYNPTVR